MALLEKPNYDCILWEGDGCKAYGARPVQCSTYPFWSWVVKSKDAWDDEAKSCKGVNKGPVRSFEEIEGQKFSYEHNIPITRNLESEI